MSKENRVQCWLCQAWVLEEHTEKRLFLGKEEQVCIACLERMENQDRLNDGKMRLRQDAKRDREAAQGKYTLGPPRLPEDAELVEREDELESLDKGQDA
jgi:hypothetical protein